MTHYYFAYGRNTNLNDMEHRCPGAVRIGNAWIDGYAFKWRSAADIELATDNYVVGVLWALHFFWFPSWNNLKVDNYYDQFIPQTSTATEFFTVLVPLMFLGHVIMCWKEWKTRMRWISISEPLSFLRTCRY